RWSAQDFASRHALMVTGGSTSIRAFEAPLREAGAGARALLSMAAASRWNADWESLDTHDGFVWRGTDRLPFAELAEAARFAGDVRLPDMVYAAVRSGPPGATLADVDRAAANHVPGALAVLRNPEWVAVAAT